MELLMFTPYDNPSQPDAGQPCEEIALTNEETAILDVVWEEIGREKEEEN